MARLQESGTVVGWDMDEKGDVIRIRYKPSRGGETKTAEVKPALGEKIRQDRNAGHQVDVAVTDGKVKSASTHAKAP